MRPFLFLNSVLTIITVFFIVLFLFIIERYRFASGSEMLIDKFIIYLEKIHNQTNPKREKEVDVQEYYVSDKVKIMELSFHEQIGDNIEASRLETDS